MSAHIPGLLHNFYVSRIDSGQSIADDDIFDSAHVHIGSLGQVVVKNQSAGSAKRKKELRREEKPEKKRSIMKKVL